MDLVETFNYLIGLRVIHTAEPQTFTAKFKRDHDHEVPEDQKTKLSIDGELQQTKDEPSTAENPSGGSEKWRDGFPAILRTRITEAGKRPHRLAETDGRS